MVGRADVTAPPGLSGDGVLGHIPHGRAGVIDRHNRTAGRRRHQVEVDVRPVIVGVVERGQLHRRPLGALPLSLGTDILVRESGPLGGPCFDIALRPGVVFGQGLAGLGFGGLCVAEQRGLGLEQFSPLVAFAQVGEPLGIFARRVEQDRQGVGVGVVLAARERAQLGVGVGAGAGQSVGQCLCHR